MKRNIRRGVGQAVMVALIAMPGWLAAVAQSSRFGQLANLPFEENRPTKQTAQTLRDELLFQRATQVYLWALPLINTLGMKDGSEKVFGAGYNVLPIWKKKLDATTLVTTPNSDVTYAMSYVDLGKGGPLVFEAPPNLQGIQLDFWQRPIPVDGGKFFGDVGLPGPDGGKGGKCLLLPPGYKGPVPDGHYVYRSATNNVFIFLRSFYQDPKNLTTLVESSKIYPLNGKDTQVSEAPEISDPSMLDRIKNKWRIIGIGTFFLLQTMFIAVFLIKRKRRQRANELLDRRNAELEERIAARTAAINAKNRELEAFAYSVAHDLKAPLRGINRYSRLLLDDHLADLNDEGRSFLKTIHSSTEEMSQLIDDLLEYSQVERRESKTDRLELRPLITSVVEQKKREMTEGDINFVVSVNGGSIVADANGFIQSLRNYLDNAIKFSHKVPQPCIEVGSKETAKNFLVWVRDNGVGFDMKYHDRIFDIFQRLNAGEDYPGTGVGLAIVRKTMERMGGRAWAESEPGRGATFYLEIPK